MKNIKKRKEKIKRIGITLVLRKKRKEIINRIEAYLLKKRLRKYDSDGRDCLWQEKEFDLILRDMYRIPLGHPNYEVFKPFKYEKLIKNPKFKKKPLWFLKKAQDGMITQYMDNIMYDLNWEKEKSIHEAPLSSYYPMEMRDAIEWQQEKERKFRNAIANMR